LHAAALEKGLDDQALHWLLRGINAHDQLLAHARVIGHLADWLAAVARGDFGPTSHLGAWTRHVPEWQTLCAWIRDERATLSRHAGLEALDRGLGRGHKHPMLYHGVDTFPLVSALWNRHERWDATVAARPDNAAARYERLQVHLLLGYLDARWALEPAKLQSYDDHDDEHEHLYTHLPSRDAARAVREFSFQRHAAALEILRPELDVHAFRQRIASSREVTGAIARMPPAERRYLEYLRRFFQRVGQITAGMGPRRTGASRYAGVRRVAAVPSLATSAGSTKHSDCGDASMARGATPTIPTVWATTHCCGKTTPRPMHRTAPAPPKSKKAAWRLTKPGSPLSSGSARRNMASGCGWPHGAAQRGKAQPSTIPGTGAYCVTQSCAACGSTCRTQCKRARDTKAAKPAIGAWPP